jgi:DNA-binding NtrC family response regulator
MVYDALNVNYHQKKSISVVDDEEDNVTLFTKVLQENGYQVKGFTSPIIILDYIHKHPDEFGLIMVDYRMSPMQGSELASKISTINPKIKMIIITAYDDIPNNDLNLEIVKKPITLSKLLQIIQQYLE